jgi:hypothetical protein
MTTMNQTDSRHLKIIESSRIPIKGIGLFVYSRDGRLTKEIQPRITYNKANEIGNKSIAFKFIPYNVELKIHGQTYVLKSTRSIPADKWVCSEKCSATSDCRHLSEVCLCVQGQCF